MVRNEGVKYEGCDMSIVTLLSGGLDSCLMTVLAQEVGQNQLPLFINYGQINLERELQGAIKHTKQFGLRQPQIMDISGFGKVISSGLTDPTKNVVDEAFLPGRNMMLLLMASSFAVQNECSSVSIGLLREETAIFPDQTDDFLFSAEYAISKSLGRKIEIITPLRDFYKKDVIQLAKERGIISSYSCHVGGETPCGTCISCMEFNN